MALIFRTLSIAVLLSASAAIAQDPTLRSAVETQRELLQENPEDPAILADYGGLLASVGRNQEAETYLRLALGMNPDSEVARYNLGVALQRLEREDEAVEEFERILLRNPEHAGSHYQLGAILEQQGRTKKATRHFVEAFSNDLSLTFTDVNPQIIDSRLTTKALIAAYAGLSRAVLAPVAFEQPERVRAMMLEIAERAAGQEEPEEAPEMEELPLEPAESDEGLFVDEEEGLLFDEEKEPLMEQEEDGWEDGDGA